MLIRPSPLVESIIGCAIEVHRTLGPGLLESAYEKCMVHELLTRGISFRCQVPLPATYKGIRIELAYRADLIVNDTILLELKSVDRLLPIHQAQVITYLKLANLRQGLLINFNVNRLVDGLKNILL
jgi:GxxExxY protein